MRRRLKKIGVALLLLLAKSFVYMRQLVERIHAPRFAVVTRTSARVALRGLVILALPPYRLYRRIRRDLGYVFAAGHSYALRSVSHRYILHAAILGLAILTAYENITTRGVGGENFGANSLVLQIVGNDEEYTLQGPLTPEELNASSIPSGSTEAPTNEPQLQTFLSYTGETVFQPYLPTTEESVAPRQRIEAYTVAVGDTLAGVAAKFHLQLQTVLAANHLTAHSLIRPGQKLTILPIDGLLHTVRRGEHLGAIARHYRVTPESVLSFNNITDERALAPGMTLVIPGGTPPPPPPPAPARPQRVAFNIPNVPPIDRGTRLLWPAINHGINQYFTWRHSGIDIHGTFGQPIYAAESGVVLEARWGGGYGNMILIQHDNGLITRYGHSSKLLVTPGERVARGQIIGLVGSTGRSTGPHIHFEVIIGGRHVNPLAYTR